jgi:hypothetical protein
MLDIIRDSSLGKVVRFATGNRVLHHLDEKPGFKLPSPIQEPEKEAEARSETSVTTNDQNLEDKIEAASRQSSGGPAAAKTTSHPIHPVLTSEGFTLVDWYATGTETSPMPLHEASSRIASFR